MISNLYRRGRLPRQASRLILSQSGAAYECRQNAMMRRFFSSDNEEKNRQTFQEYWQRDHSTPTIENMMLDSDAGSMDLLDRPEILAELPSLSGKKILELGAGIGRFSAPLSQKAESVIAVDFVEASCTENRRLNADKDNLKVICGDATQIDFPPGSFDLVFSNWLLMYLTDEELETFATKALRWLTPGGHVFFRESCFHSSGNAKRRFNPTQYRSPEDYSQAFTRAAIEDGSRFQLRASSCVDVYAKIKGNVHQMWFRYEKITEEIFSRQKAGQYTQFKALRYESIYGENYIQPGGDELSQKLLDVCEAKLTPRARLLDIGCGLGGTMLYMANKCPEVYFHGVSCSGELAAIGIGRHVQRPREIRDRISFEVVSEMGVPAGELKYPPNLFDVMLFHGQLMHVNMQDKGVLLRKASRLLAPGGKCLVIDYCRGKAIEDSTEEFRSYLDDRGYTLLTPEEELEQLKLYFQVEKFDLTDDFSRWLDAEMERIEEHYGNGATEKLQDASEVMEELKGNIEQQVMKVLEDQGVAQDAAVAALEKVALHLDATSKEARRKKKNYEWFQKYWTTKKRAVLQGELKYVLYVATMKS
eukprot:gnl/MRDRNA2_/MRDRNA2_86039_c0_seq2.p1 gnl/MRDRNA2_/MRDRNA2_86039_c0~~gnl/MRDRNA2_/MRDRNA2_86039_c0_seq2.p1  ORF type:complete len:589 (-),score=118.58 gnl/MRDRNA2_/MRDRNA2_86039_c0_seq2:295-2061(-)